MSTVQKITARTSTRNGRFAAFLALAAGSATALAQTDFGDIPGLAPIGDVAPDAQPNDDSAVAVNDHELIELHFRDEDLATALQILSIQAQRSVVTTQSVSGSVTANLFGVGFYEALDAILLYNGYGYIEENGTIYVMPREQIENIIATQRQREYSVISLNYLTAVDAAQFVQPLLSPEGAIVTNGATPDFSLQDSAPSNKDDYAGSGVLVVFDYPETLNQVRSLVSELDTKPVSVLVQATVLQNSLSEGNAWGVDFSIIDDMDFADFVDVGGPLNVVNGMIAGSSKGGGGGEGETVAATMLPTDGTGSAYQSTVGRTGGPGGFKFGVVKDDIAVFLRLLDEVGDTTIISNPKILTLNRQAASVQVGRRVGYLSTTTTDTSTQQTVEFLDTGTQLYVRPFVTNNGYIRMELRPEISQPIIRTVSSSDGSTATIPDEDTSTLSANVIVRDGDTIVLGGLFTERTVSSRRQVPGFGDLPWIGYAFRGMEDTTDRAEIVFLVTPETIGDDDMADQGAAGEQLVVDSRAGAREGLLIWSRERRTSQMLVRAQRMAAQGDTDGALAQIRRSLALSHNQPEAIALRESLLSKPTIWPTSSGLERIINHETEERMEMFRQSVTLMQEQNAAQDATQPASDETTPTATTSGTAAQVGRSDGSDSAQNNVAQSQSIDDQGEFSAVEDADEAFGADEVDAYGWDGLDQSPADGQGDWEQWQFPSNDEDQNRTDDLYEWGIDDADSNPGDAATSELSSDSSADRDMGFWGWSSSNANAEVASDNRPDTQVANTADDTLGRFVSTQDQLQSLVEEVQYQIDLYHQNTGSYPSLTQLQSRPANSSFGSSFGVLVDAGYLFQAPTNPFLSGSQASAVGTAGQACAFEYDPSTGEIRGSVPVNTINQTVASTQTTLQNQIELFRARTGAYPTLSQLQAAPSNASNGSTFGVLINGSYLQSSPVNPYFVGTHASRVGEFGSGAAWEYNQASGAIHATLPSFAQVQDDSQFDD
ncbi:MAG: hypothetical protein H6811_09650 [Phycisphaeraceae bacterium]|nr:hypothetical protein [Phycisphaeraceae bacterium]